jgi:DNA-binding NarL/FixJ family response regulator
MDPPPVHYVTTSDGFSIAYTDSGHGMPLIFMPVGFNHVQLSWTILSAGSWLAAANNRFRLVHFDSRGQGMSTRGLPEDALATDWDRDLETVADELNIPRFVLLGVGGSAHSAVRYAIKHPGRVHALVLLNAAVSSTSGPLSISTGLAQEDWDVFLRNVSPAVDWSPNERRDAVDRFRKMTTQEDYLAALRARASSDISALVAHLKTPTLVLHARDYNYVDSSEATRLASLIPRARLTLIDGTDLFGDAAQGMRAIDAFLADIPPTQAATPGGTLSHREIEVLRLVAEGKSNPQIADELVISVNTVRRHVSNIFAKSGVANRTEASIYARDQGLA